MSVRAFSSLVAKARPSLAVLAVVIDAVLPRAALKNALRPSGFFSSSVRAERSSTC
ncbi:hypothetical protein D3C85_1452840 [compost metagenome]